MAVQEKRINPDLQEERDSATFSITEFQNWWYGGQDKLKKKREIEKELLKGKSVNHEHEYLSFKDAYNTAIKEVTEYGSKLRKLQEERNPGGDDIWPKMIFDPAMGILTPNNHPFITHASMYLDAVMNQGTPEQVEKFGLPSKRHQIIGTYAQTEMGHGTNVRGLQTRADFDRSTDQFIINTPSLEAYKCWAGGLGHTSNHALVIAQLYIDNVHKGLQMFLVPIRDPETHEPLPGIHVGELGKKLGMVAVNQGYMGLKNVRIPRTNMLMKNAKVLRDGTFIPSSNERLTYLTLVYARLLAAEKAIEMHLLAATIATRYSAVRRQSPIDPNVPEPKIMDHVTQQLKLFPEIASGIALGVTTSRMWELYDETLSEVNKGDLSHLQEMHVLACIIKAIGCSDSCVGIERLRFACGGFGYLAASNFGKFYNDTAPICTFDGDTTVLLLQVGRFLMKSWRQIEAGDEKLPGSMVYMQQMRRLQKFPAWQGTTDCLLRALKYIATNKTRVAFENLSRRLAEGKTTGQAFNLTGIELTQAAELHGRQLIASTLLEKIEGLRASSGSESLSEVLWKVLELHLLHTVLRYIGDVLRFIELTEADVSGLQRRLELSLQQLRPNAVAICDGFDFHDAILNSVLGCYDGNVYERIFESTKESPLNQKPVPDSFKKYLLPFMQSKL